MLYQVNSYILTNDDKLSIKSFIKGLNQIYPNAELLKGNPAFIYMPATRWLKSVSGATLKDCYHTVVAVWNEDKEPILSEDAFIYG